MSTPEPDWALWRSFAAVVADGSLSAAGRRIGYSQPTLGRHIETLEQLLGTTLFVRTLQGLKPTEAALRLYEPVARAEQSLTEAAFAAAGTQPSVTGTVRIAASRLIAHHLLPVPIRSLREAFPAVAMTLVPDAGADLARSADIGLWPAEPDDPELVSRRIGEIPLVLCAHQSYLGARGTPAVASDLAGHALIGPDRETGPLTLAVPAVKRADVTLRSDDETARWEMLKAGLGIGIAPLNLVHETHGMREVLSSLKLPPLDLWIATHPELFLQRRIRAIYERLAEGLAATIARTPRRPGTLDAP